MPWHAAKFTAESIMLGKVIFMSPLLVWIVFLSPRFCKFCVVQKEGRLSLSFLRLGDVFLSYIVHIYLTHCHILHDVSTTLPSTCPVHPPLLCILPLFSSGSSEVAHVFFFFFCSVSWAKKWVLTSSLADRYWMFWAFGGGCWLCAGDSRWGVTLTLQNQEDPSCGLPLMRRPSATWWAGPLPLRKAESNRGRWSHSFLSCAKQDVTQWFLHSRVLPLSFDWHQ